MEKPVSLAKEDWSLGAHHLQYLCMETLADGTSEGSCQGSTEDPEKRTAEGKDYDIRFLHLIVDLAFKNNPNKPLDP